MGKFEEEIKQFVFTNDIHKAILNIIYTANFINNRNALFFKEYGILGQHYNILRIVRGRKGEAVSPGQIIEVMMDKGRDLTRLVDKLVINGYLKRNPSKSNRRKIDITITEEGLNVTNEIETKINNWIDSKIKIPEIDARKLNEFLDEIRK